MKFQFLPKAAVRFFSASFQFFFLLAFLAPGLGSAQTWEASPVSGDWNTAGNWSAGVPLNSQTTGVTFGASSQTNITLDSAVVLGDMDFNNGAPGYNLTLNGPGLDLYGAGILQGTGQTLTVSSGTLGFHNSSTAGSAALLNSGNLIFSDSSSAGTAQITNGFGGYLAFNDSATAGGSSITNNYITSFNNSSSAGNAFIDNEYNLNFHDSASAGAASIFNNGITLTFNDGSTAGTASIDNSDDLYFLDHSTAGSASLTNNANLYFSGDDDGIHFATAGNASITNNNHLEFNDYSTAGSAAITNNGGLYFLGYSSGGAARIINTDTGVLDISGDNLPVTLGSIEGSGSFLLGANRLAAGSNNLDSLVSGNIFDGELGGSLAKIGTGTLTLAGDNSYSGGTEIEGGALLVGNSGALGTGSLLVDNGAALGFSGTVALQLEGDYHQAASGTLQWGLGKTGGDLLMVEGTATLNGTLQLVSLDGYHLHRAQTYTVLSSDTDLAGEFSSVSDQMEGTTYIVTYDGDNVLLQVTGLTFNQLGVSPNQKIIGSLLDSLNADSDKPALIDSLSYQSNASLPGDFDEISPALVTSIYQMGFALAESQGEIVEQRLSRLWAGERNGALAWNGGGTAFAGILPASEEKSMLPKKGDGWGAFADGIGNFGTVSSDGNGPGYDFSIGGMAAGLDCALAKDLTGGLLIGYDLSGTGKSAGKVSASGGQLGLYGGWKSDDFHLGALASGGIHQYDIERAGYGGTASGKTQGVQYSGTLSAGFDWGQDHLKFGPSFSVQYSRVNFSAFSETGSLAPLTYGSQGESYLRSDLGASITRSLDCGGVNLSPNVSFAWEHLYNGYQDGLQAVLGDSFSVSGPALGTDAVVLGAGVSADFGKGFGLFAQYEGKLGLTNYESQNFSGGLSFGL